MPANLDRALDDMIHEESSRRRPDDAKAAAPRSGSTVRVAKRVYVGNLSYHTSWQSIKDHFRKVGPVVFCNTLMDPRTGRSLGCGVVEFETPADAATAIRTMHDSVLEGRPLVVREDRDDRDLQSGGRSHTVAVDISDRGQTSEKRVSRRPSGKGYLGISDRGQTSENRGGRRVYVGNVSYETTWQMLKDHFKKAGKVVFANVMQVNGKHRGCGLVEYDSPEDAAVAIAELHDSTLDGRLLVVREDREDPEMKNSAPVTSSSSATHRRATKRKRRRDESSYSDDSSEDSSPRRSPRRSPPPDGRVRVARRVYVGNLAFETTWQELKDHFRSAGSVVYANVIGKSGSGIVEFEHPTEAKHAIEKLFDSVLNGRKMIVREDREDRDLQRGGTRGTVVARTSALSSAEDDRKRRRT